MKKKVSIRLFALVMSIIFMLLTFAGAGYVLINHGQVNAGYAVIPMSFCLVCVAIVLIFIALITIHGSYLEWDYSDPELAVAGTILHGFEFLFVRLAPIALGLSIVGIAVTYKRDSRIS